MRVVKVEALCFSCGHEWWTRKALDECPSCWTQNETGWSADLEEKILAETTGQTVTV